MGMSRRNRAIENVASVAMLVRRRAAGIRVAFGGVMRVQNVSVTLIGVLVHHFRAFTILRAVSMLCFSTSGVNDVTA